MATVDNRLPTEGTQIDIESRLHAIETALASLMTDTTGQDIKTAINNLAGAISPAAASVSFTNTGTDLTATNVQGLGVEINNKINGLVKKSSVSLTFDTSGRTTIQLNMGRIIAIDFQTTNYTYTLRYLSATQTLIYLRRADTLALITNDSNSISADIYYV